MTKGQQDDVSFRLLHALRLKGRADLYALVRATGTTLHEAASHLRQAEHSGLVREQGGTPSRWMLTPEGVDRHRRGLDAERAGGAGTADTLEAAYDAFLRLNAPFKRLCTDWQTGGDDRASCIERLADVHAALQGVLDSLVAARARFMPYRTRFAAAITRVRSGDGSGFARPLTDSFHDVWMELHEDLLQTLGQQRSTHDGV